MVYQLPYGLGLSEGKVRIYPNSRSLPVISFFRLAAILVTSVIAPFIVLLGLLLLLDDLALLFRTLHVSSKHLAEDCVPRPGHQKKNQYCFC